MNKEIEIRKANKDDLVQILGLYSQKDIDNGSILNVEQAEQIMDRFMLYPNYNLYVALTGNKIVGTFALMIMDNLAHLGSPSGVVEDVVVDEQFRSKGVGKHMMQFAINVCRKNKCYKLSLSSNLKRDRAHKFYENLGFEKHGYSYLIELS